MYQKVTLDNGLRVLTAPMPQTRSVSISIFIGVGSRYEDEREAGISHFIEHMLFKGTGLRPAARDVSEAIEGVGGVLNGGTDKELTVYWCKVADRHFAMSLGVLVDMLLNSRFDPADIEKERQVIMEEINLTWDFPSQRVDMLIDESLWPDHPLGREIAGTKESIAGITREALLAYRESHYLPQDTVIAIAGNIEHDSAITEVKKVMGRWLGARKLPQCLPYRGKGFPRLKIETRDTEQTHFCLALPGISITDPGRFAVDLMNVILGEGMSSRLFSEVRDRLGLVYSISSYVDHFLDTGSLIVCAGVDARNLRAAIGAILTELVRLKETIPPAELTKAKELSKGRLLLRMEDSRSVAGWLGGQEVLSNQIISIDEMIAKIDAISGDEVTQMARQLLVDRWLRLVVVGPVPPDEPLEETLKLG